MPHDAPAHDHHEHEDDQAQKHGKTTDREKLARADGREKVLFLDAFSGIAGDMLVAALLDLGVPEEELTGPLAALPLAGYRLEHGRRTRSGIDARSLDVIVDEEQPSRDYAAIADMLAAASGLAEGARSLAQRAFRLLAEAEARVHGTTPEHVHFHEVGAVDSIVDIVAAAIGLDYLGAEVVCSPLPMGRGMIRSQHGMIPGPAPATVECLAGVPTHDAGIDFELVTPTGACLVRAAASRFARWPQMAPERVGWGAGRRELPDRPNLLRLVLGTPTGATEDDAYVVIETNVDDMSGEIAAAALVRAAESGALDAWSTPIGMKKGRPALMLSALAPAGSADTVARALLSETTSLGVRMRPVRRIERPRRHVHVQTPFGTIPVKVADGDGLPANVAPEYEACSEAARAHGVPLKEVYAAAIAAYRGT